MIHEKTPKQFAAKASDVTVSTGCPAKLSGCCSCSDIAAFICRNFVSQKKRKNNIIRKGNPHTIGKKENQIKSRKLMLGIFRFPD